VIWWPTTLLKSNEYKLGNPFLFLAQAGKCEEDLIANSRDQRVESNFFRYALGALRSADLQLKKGKYPWQKNII
jgi:hypothetical protein